MRKPHSRGKFSHVFHWILSVGYERTQWQESLWEGHLHICGLDSKLKHLGTKCHPRRHFRWLNWVLRVTWQHGRVVTTGWERLQASMAGEELNRLLSTSWYHDKGSILIIQVSHLQRPFLISQTELATPVPNRSLSILLNHVYLFYF